MDGLHLLAVTGIIVGFRQFGFRRRPLLLVASKCFFQILLHCFTLVQRA